MQYKAGFLINTYLADILFFTIRYLPGAFLGLEFSLANICIYNNHITVTLEKCSFTSLWLKERLKFKFLLLFQNDIEVS